ncbi:MAG TPA: class D sortase [Vicinamibacterales bacterium]|nr:class D sortase [Vicinamibacterales bacterium]
MEPGIRNLTLKWIERALLTAGAVLGAWCAAAMLEARFVKSLPIPHQYVDVAKSLPGDAGSAHAAPAPAAPAPGTWLARMEMPSLKLTATVLEGSDDGTLSRGAGHIEDTSFPDDVSAGSNIGIAGHRDTIFRPLRNVHDGDPLTLTTSKGTYRYRVVKTIIVGPDDVYVLDPTNAPTITLVTCYPFEFIGHAPKRFIVQAELVSEPGSADKAGGPGDDGPGK